MAEVECVVWLDYSFARTMSQSLGRVIGRSLRGQEIWPGTGNRESFLGAILQQEVDSAVDAEDVQANSGAVSGLDGGGE